jgi:hypothetical protein
MIKIIDNIIPIDIQNNLEKKILLPNFPWGRMTSSDLAEEASLDYLSFKRKEFADENIIDPPQCYHNILIDQQPGPFFEWFTPILDAIKLENMCILRMKMNFNFPFIGSTEKSYGIPHVDLPNEETYTTGIYYLTDADGDTILFNQRKGYIGKLTEQKRVTPKKGRIVLFNGNILHAACPPASNLPRIVVNINIR